MSNSKFFFLCSILFMIVSNTEKSKTLEGQYGFFGVICLLMSMGYYYKNRVDREEE